MSSNYFMLKFTIIVFVCFLSSCLATEQKSPLVIKTELPKDLKEISGITAQGAFIWAITDKPHAQVFKLDLSGNIVQQISVTNTEATDVEAVAADSNFVYIGDVGDNKGDRPERKIIKIARTNIGAGKEVEVTGEIIEFLFPGDEEVGKKKENNFDCESLLSYKDSLYVFTKDREDKETRLYVLPKSAGKYTARFIDSYNSKGLITDAAINPANNEVALIGYHKGHKYPFMIVFDKFQGNDFFSGEHKKINLADKPWDWQLEGITYGENNMMYFSCEGSKEVAATFYGIKREDLSKLNKKKQEDYHEGEDQEGSGLTKKGHLKL